MTTTDQLYQPFSSGTVQHGRKLERHRGWLAASVDARSVRVNWDYVALGMSAHCNVYHLPAELAEPDPAATLALLVSMLPSAAPDYADTPEQAQRRSRVTEALFSAQADSIAQNRG